jgi:DNA-binding LytR/AlgR family response regulator
MKVIIAEDEPLFANTLEMFVDKLGYELVALAGNSEDFLETFAQHEADVALLDIMIEGKLDGIGVAEHINESANPIPIIFITSHNAPEVFERAKRTKPYAYLIKPFVEADLERTIELAVYQYHYTKINEDWNEKEDFNTWHHDVLGGDCLFVKVDAKLEKIRIQDIAYLIVEDKYLQLFTLQKKYLVRMTLKEIIEKLPHNNFVQIHRNYIVNIQHVSDIDLKHDTINILGQHLTISKRLKDYFLNRLNKLG